LYLSCQKAWSIVFKIRLKISALKIGNYMIVAEANNKLLMILKGQIYHIFHIFMSQTDRRHFVTFNILESNKSGLKPDKNLIM